MRAGADVYNRMPAALFEHRVVPPASEIVACLLVRGVGHPLRAHPTGLGFREEDHDLLPVGLVVVGAEKVAPPIVESVEEPVLQDDPAVLPDRSSVVPEVFLFLHE